MEITFEKRTLRKSWKRRERREVFLERILGLRGY